ncbi:asparagine synthase (glutamine-hydrolyzing) [soil metagenome]
MCGVAGIFHLDGAPASPVVLRAMTDAIAHRGPDGQGAFTDGALALGHRRLAIIDLTPAGHQPMASADGGLVISYNGEIYNFLELRADLESLGHQFRSRSDTEVALAAIRQWGEGAIEKFNGMFAFAVWDRRRRRLVLARDRFGVKPLYTWTNGRTLLFASEIKAFLAVPEFRASVDPRGLVEYMTFQNFLTDRTLFKDVSILPAGTFLVVDADARKVPEPQRYWDFRFEDDGSITDRAEAEDNVDFLFQQAVGRQLVSDVPVGSYLSGGMDSGSITAIAARQSPMLHTFTVGFDLSSASGLELASDERRAAERMSYLFGTEHYEMVLKAGDMERCMRSLVWHIEEPRVGQSYPNYYAAKLASRFGKVVLSGAGGDELFAGYPWRYYRTAASTGFDDYVNRYYGFWQRLLPSESVPGIFGPLGSTASDVNTLEIFRSVFDNHATELSKPEDYINHSLYFEAKTFLHGLLVVEDKVSMAHSLEARVPFLDNDLVDYASRVPLAMKLANFGEVPRIDENTPGSKTGTYFARTNDGKLILRSAMSRHIPPNTTDAIKQGFSGPDASWFRGESIDYVRRTLMRPDARLWNYLDRGIVQGLVTDHVEGRQNRRLLIWSLLNLDTWLDVFEGHASVSSTGSERISPSGRESAPFNTLGGMIT